ncbi:hypothetical protein D3C75_1001130 [compost metagenome]
MGGGVLIRGQIPLAFTVYAHHQQMIILIPAAVLGIDQPVVGHPGEPLDAALGFMSELNSLFLAYFLNEQV